MSARIFVSELRTTCWRGLYLGKCFTLILVVNGGKVVFSGVNQYGRPPMQVAHQGGAYISRTLLRGSTDEKTLMAINKKLVKALRASAGCNAC